MWAAMLVRANCPGRSKARIKDTSMSDCDRERGEKDVHEDARGNTLSCGDLGLPRLADRVLDDRALKPLTFTRHGLRALLR